MSEAPSVVVLDYGAGNVRSAVRALEEAEHIEGIIHMKTLHLGPDELLVAAKIAVAPTESALEVARAIDTAEAAIRGVEPSARVIYLEPDIYRPQG